MMGGFAMLAGVVGVPVTYQIATLEPPPAVEITGPIALDIDNLATVTVLAQVDFVLDPAIACDNLGDAVFDAQICLPDFAKHPAGFLPGRTVLTLADCSAAGPPASCIDKKKILDGLEERAYRFKHPETMFLGDPRPVALVIDTAGKADFEKELGGQPGKEVSGRTKVSLKMEAELSGGAFDIEPKGRIESDLLLLNPARWDWTVTAKHEGKWPLQLSLYVILTDSENNKIGEDKPLAERRTIQIDVYWLDRATMWVAKIDPILTVIIAAVTAIAGLLAWFGWRDWPDLLGRKKETKPQQLEITIKVDGGGAGAAETAGPEKPPATSPGTRKGRAAKRRPTARRKPSNKG